MKFQKWDGYWQKGKPYLDAVQVVPIPDEMDRCNGDHEG